MKKYIVLIALLSLCSSALAVGSTVYPWPTAWSLKDLAQWSQPLMYFNSTLPATYDASPHDIVVLAEGDGQFSFYRLDDAGTAWESLKFNTSAIDNSLATMSAGIAAAALKNGEASQTFSASQYEQYRALTATTINSYATGNGDCSRVSAYRYFAAADDAVQHDICSFAGKSAMDGTIEVQASTVDSTSTRHYGSAKWRFLAGTPTMIASFGESMAALGISVGVAGSGADMAVVGTKTLGGATGAGADVWAECISIPRRTW